jgi:hypothetical protein
MPGGKVDHVNELDEFLVLLARDLAGNKNAQMPDTLVYRVDNGLTVGDHLILVIVEVEDPVQSLLRWSDVVSLGTEHDDRRLDVA